MLKISVDFKSFFMKGTKPYDEDFDIFLITGYQGTGKTWFSIYNLEERLKKYDRKIKTNIHSYHSQNYKNIEYFEKIEQLYDDEQDNLIVVIDELSKRYNKNSPLDKNFYSWLQQSRKHNRIVIMIMQEYINVPQWLRGVCTSIYNSSKVIFFLPIFKTIYGVPVLDDNFEWQISPQGVIIYKRTKKISTLYDTFEAITEL